MACETFTFKANEISQSVLDKPIPSNEWFDENVIIGENNSPMIMFHGTNTKIHFDKFNPNYSKTEQLGFGIHFTPSIDFSKKYAEKQTGRIYAVAIKSKKLLKANQIVKEGSPEFALALKMNKKMYAAKDENGIRGVYLQNIIDSVSPQKAQKIIQESGYDAVEYKAIYGGKADAYGRRQIDIEATSFIVFSSDNIFVL